MKVLYWLKTKILELPLITKASTILSVSCLYIFKDQYLFESLWNNIYEKPIVTNPFFPTLLMTISYFVLYIPYAFLDASHFIKEYKIQKNHYPNKKEISKSLILWLKSQIFIDLPFALCIYLMNVSTTITKEPPKLGMFIWIFYFMLFIVFYIQTCYIKKFIRFITNLKAHLF
jgi:hypothetical protein